MKRRYHISPEGRPRPTEKEIERLNDPKRLLYNYDKAVRRPKVPIYKDPKALNANYSLEMPTEDGKIEKKDIPLRRAMNDRSPTSFRTLAWHMLFDLLRVKGDRETFDLAAITYVNETESSAPAWSDELKAPVTVVPARRCGSTPPKSRTKLSS